MTKFDGSDPTGWVTQMEHYFSLYDITNDLNKLRYGVIHLDQEHWQWWQWTKTFHQGYISWTHFMADLYEFFDTPPKTEGEHFFLVNNLGISSLQ